MTNIRNRQRPFHLLKCLYENTDENHAVSTPELERIFQAEDAHASRKTVKDVRNGMDTQRGARNSGKTKCKTLKEIRRKIALVNNIPFNTVECDYDGPCSGTCPKCDEEIRYLERALRDLQDRGEHVNIGGVGRNELYAYAEAVNKSPTCEPLSEISQMGEREQVMGMIQYLPPRKDGGMETAGVPNDPYWRFRQEDAERSRRSRRLLIGALVFLIIVLVFLIFLLYRYTHGILLGSRIRFLLQMKGMRCFGLRILTGCGPGASL